MNCLTVCVDYHDYLAITLPRNRQFFAKYMIVTSYGQPAALHKLTCDYGCQLFVTDAFYEDGAEFNKGRAIEHALNVFGRDGWISILDADVVLPNAICGMFLTIGNLYGCHRRMLADPGKLGDYPDWFVLPDVPAERAENEIPGYWHCFHAADPVLQCRPWYGTDWRHAGGCDSDFQAHWPRERRKWLPFECLHLGQPFVNWCGRATAFLDTGEYPEHAGERAATTAAMIAQHRRGRYGIGKFRSGRRGEASE